MSLTNKKIVFSGFRDENLKAMIESKGGVVVNTVNSKTSYVVTHGAKGVTSSKVLKAKQLKKTVIDKDDFIKQHFSPSLLQSLWNKISSNTSSPSHTETITTYYIHDNMGRPFKFQMNSKRFWVYKGKYSWDDNKYSYDKIIIQPTEYAKIFIGKCPEYGKKFDGNSILVKFKQTNQNSYLYIGSRIFSFTPTDEILEYHSPIRGSDVPYPYAVGHTNNYLLLEATYLPNELVPIGTDPYDFFYSKVKNELMKKYSMSKHMNLKVVQKRL